MAPKAQPGLAYISSLLTLLQPHRSLPVLEIPGTPLTQGLCLLHLWSFLMFRLLEGPPLTTLLKITPPQTPILAALLALPGLLFNFFHNAITLYQAM